MLYKAVKIAVVANGGQEVSKKLLLTPEQLRWIDSFMGKETEAKSILASKHSADVQSVG